MVYTERAEMAAVSCGTSHASAVSTPFRWIFKKKKQKKNALYKIIHSCRITCERSESARERTIALYKSEQQAVNSGPTLISLMVSVDVKHHVYLSKQFMYSV